MSSRESAIKAEIEQATRTHKTNKFGKRDSEDPETAPPVVDSPDPRKDFPGQPPNLEGTPAPRVNFEPSAPLSTPLADQLRSCRAPAFCELIATAGDVKAAKEAFAQVGAYGNPDRPVPSATVVQVDRERNGRFTAETIRPDRSMTWLEPQVIFDIWKGGGENAALAALAALVKGLRTEAAVKGLPLLVLIDSCVFERNQTTAARLKDLAAQADALVVMVKQQPGFGEAVFRSEAVEPQAAPEVAGEAGLVAERAHEVKAEQAAAIPEQWFNSPAFRKQIDGYPENIRGPASHGSPSIHTTYRPDARGMWVRMKGHREDNGHSRELEVLTDNGVVLPISEFPIRL